MNIDFEDCGFYITATDGDRVVIRCHSAATDLSDSEPLHGFVRRHGGPEATAEYLARCHREAYAH